MLYFRGHICPRGEVNHQLCLSCGKDLESLKNFRNGASIFVICIMLSIAEYKGFAWLTPSDDVRSTASTIQVP